MLFQILDSDRQEIFNDALDKLIGSSIIEPFGKNKEYLKLNDGVRDFLLRAGHRIQPKYKERLKKDINSFFSNDSIKFSDLSAFIYSLKSSLTDNHKFINKYLLPSHYLKTMVNLYERDRDYEDVVILADRVLENQKKIDIGIVRDVKYWQCLSLARLKLDRFKSEVQFFKNNEQLLDYYFLMGFYYRMIGKPEYALEQFNLALEEKSNYARVRREIVQVLLYLEQFDDAFEDAKVNYENDSTNAYQIQAYIDCLIRKRDTKDTILIQKLLKELRDINTPRAEEMAKMALADYYYYIENNYDKAIETIDEAISESKNSPYAINRKFNIVENAKNIAEMEKTIQEYEDRIKKKNDPNDTNGLLIMKAKLLAHKGETKGALGLIDARLLFFPEQTKQRLTKYLMSI